MMSQCIYLIESQRQLHDECTSYLHHFRCQSRQQKITWETEITIEIYSRGELLQNSS